MSLLNLLLFFAKKKKNNLRKKVKLRKSRVLCRQVCIFGIEGSMMCQMAIDSFLWTSSRNNLEQGILEKPFV